jgi:hypothetical protein
MTDLTLQASPEQRAALTLHALAAADRDWLLHALPAERQPALRAMLTQLQAIGIPADRGFVDAVVQRRSSVSPCAPASSAAEVARTLALLDGEPPRVLAALLGAQASQFHEQARATLPAERLARARECGPAGPALQAAVCQEVARCLRASAAAPRSRWQGLRSMLQFPRRAA